MICYRPFRNSDPPAIAEIWNRQPPLRAVMQPVSPALLDAMVFSKPYFDRHGLIVAVNGSQPVGFVHAGFGPGDDGARLNTELGITCLVMAAPHPQRAQIAAELLARGEDFLRRQGARALYGGGVDRLNPFYLGLYGGSNLPGVLASDAAALALYRSAGYQETGRYLILQRPLANFRPPVDRRQLQIRRRCRIETAWDPPAETWWEACVWGETEHTRLDLLARGSVAPLGVLSYWDIEPLASQWGVHARGLVRLQIDPAARRKGLATFLVGEALRRMQAEGVSLAELQLRRDNTAALGLFKKLGFQEVEQGVVFHKES